MYHEGRGVAQDYAQAFAWCRKAANQSYDCAAFSLGEMYAHGEGVPRDITEAAAWYRKAAKLANADARKALRKLKDTKSGTTGTTKKALRKTSASNR